MAKVPNTAEILPKFSIALVGRTNVTDRQTDDRQTDGRAIAYSEREREFTFAKNFSLFLNIIAFRPVLCFVFDVYIPVLLCDCQSFIKERKL